VARDRELAAIDQLVQDALRGRAGVVALHGESGVGKSALVDAAGARARALEMRTVQVRGVASPPTAREPGVLASWPGALRELAVRVGPGPSDALRLTAEIAAAAPAPTIPAGALDAAASSLRRMAGENDRALLLTVDDCQRLPAALVIALAAAVVMRLGDEPVGLVLAWRDTPHLAPFALAMDQVQVHELGGLTLGQSHELLTSRCDDVPAEPVLAQLARRTGGNPLALVSACARLSDAQLAGWHPLPDPLPIGASLTEAFDVIGCFPPATRRALAVVAAAGAPREVVAEAMRRLGVGFADLGPALEAGIFFRQGARIDFRHPLVRSAAFFRAPQEVRRTIRRALSDALSDAGLVEAGAYQASIDVEGPDALAEHRLVDAAAVALTRGEPAAAARYEELAARCAASLQSALAHRAGAAGHWAAAGEASRARHCLDAGTRPAASSAAAAAAAELDYHQARLSRDGQDHAPERMVEAAERCAGERPRRALAMLLDAAAWRLLEDEVADAGRVADRAVHLAGTMSGHEVVLARTVRAAAAGVAGGKVDDIGERGHVSLLVGQSERFPASPEVAFVIGRSLLQQGLRRQAARWAQWIARCAARGGDVPLAAVSRLLDADRWLSAGDLASATGLLAAHPFSPESTGSMPLDAWGLRLTTSVHAMAGRYEPALAAATQLFSSFSGAVASAALLRVLPALALLELQRGRTDAALAWARAAVSDLGLADPSRRAAPGTLAEVAPLTTAVLLLARSPAVVYVEPGSDGVGVAGAAGAGAAGADAGSASSGVPQWCRAWLEGASENADALRAIARLDQASVALDDRPILQMLAQLCSGVRLADAGFVADASGRFALVERRARAAGASSIAALAAREQSALGQRPLSPSAVLSPPAAPSLSAAPASGVSPGTSPVPEWEVCVLGGFSVRHRGELLALPASRATQAIKIAALEPRLSVEQLTELLWEGAEPRVGTRRLRNVLWRIRSVCGELILRDGGSLRLAPGAVTDLGRFRTLAEQALVGPGAGTPKAIAMAHAALRSYRGELLPDDRYADWPAAARESATRTYVRLLELLVDDALRGDRQVEALVLLERLAEADPYDERHQLRAAEIHLRAGNRGRALDAVERAERTLAGLGVAPSESARTMRERLAQA
jgi:DNA-binding SARP family transcriptional activator